jgi:FkbM family methyltransferase
VEKVVVDVGANDGFYGSNSHPFIKRGWRAVLIEPHPYAFGLASKRYSGHGSVRVLNVACSSQRGEMPLHLLEDDYGGSLSTLDARSARGRGHRKFSKTVAVKVETLTHLLREHEVPRNFGLLSIDTEGHDLQVLEGLDLEQFKPTVIITENGPDEERKSDLLQISGYRRIPGLDHDSVWFSGGIQSSS